MHAAVISEVAKIVKRQLDLAREKVGKVPKVSKPCGPCHTRADDSTTPAN